MFQWIEAHPKRALWVVVGIGVLLPLIYSFVFRVPPRVDARMYNDIATHVAQGLGYRASLEGPIALDGAIGRVGPGYPIFIAMLYRVFGFHLAVVWIAQAALAGISVYCVYRLSVWLLPDHKWKTSGALCAALFIAICPDLVTISSMLLTETLSITLFLLWTVLFISHLSLSTGIRRLGMTLILGIIIALSLFVRTTTLLFLAPTLGILLFRKRWFETGAVCIVVGLCFIPWAVRNARIYQRFLPTNTAFGVNISAGNYLGASGEYEGLSPAALEIVEKISDPIEQSRALTSQAMTFMRQHPFEYLRLCVKRLGISISAVRPSAFWFHLTKSQILITAILSSLHIFGLFLFGIFGLQKAACEFSRWKSAARERYVLIVAAFCILLAPPILIIAESRYRFGLYPFLAIYAVHGLLLWQKGDRKKLLLMGLGYGMICIIDLVSKAHVVASRLG